MRYTQAMHMLYYRWKDVDWALIRSRISQWQRIIFSASKEGNIRKVRKYQHRIIESMEGKLFAVRRVTQDNKGKKTAGIDKVKLVPPEQRFALAKSLKIPSETSPVRRVWIPKPGKSEKRPLGIPTMKDRCLQALFKLALEPEWEAKFEANSFGFRPGRSCHDAIAEIRILVQARPKYVLDADIAKCFDRINHDYLLDKIGMKGKYRKLIKSWLKCGVVDANIFTETDLGTPQGGVISPLLANIALHGMEQYCQELIKDIPTLGSTGRPIPRNRRKETLGFVRYADDFVFLHPDLKIIQLIREKLPGFLNPIGLELSEAKTRISHTLEINEETKDICPGFEGKPGFNFMGFFIRQHKTKHLSAYDRQSKKLGFRTLIIPAKEKRKAYQQKLHDLIHKYSKKISQDELISKLNPVIRGWANYFGKSDANTMGILSNMDNLLYLKLRQWAKRTFKTAGKAKTAFRKVRNRTWTFATNNLFILTHEEYSQPLSGYTKVRGSASPYDGNESYWSKRLISDKAHKKRVAKLLTKQVGQCKWCNQLFEHDDIMEVDHIIPLKQNGEDKMENLQLLHRHCHDTKTAQDNKLYF
nr:hypothetical protein [Microspora sp. UTEX LB472]